MGANLGLETAFLSAELARSENEQEDHLLPLLQRISGGAGSLEEWLDVNDYLVRLVRRFRREMPVLHSFAQGVVAPFEHESLLAFADWYRDSTRAGRQVRCVFEDSRVYRDLTRQLHVRHRKENLLGNQFQSGSLLVEPGTTHFDLESPTLIIRHLDSLVEALRKGTPPSRA